MTTLLKGPEVLLPEGWSNPDKEGHNRPDVRLAWWKERNNNRSYSFAELAVPGSGTMPTSDIPLESLSRCPSYTSKDVPVVFGHYWFRATTPVPLTYNAACIDYSVARDGGQLVAYSWSGEQTLAPDNFHCVERIGMG